MKLDSGRGVCRSDFSAPVRASGYDRSRTLVVEPPALGFLVGSDGDGGREIAVDSAGNACLTGYTGSTAASFPDTPGALDQSDTGR
jgi:hypothetical protein